MQITEKEIDRNLAGDVQQLDASIAHRNQFDSHPRQSRHVLTVAGNELRSTEASRSIPEVNTGQVK